MKSPANDAPPKIDRRSLTSANNGKNSRGPVTDEGKAIVARNALRHGLVAIHIVLDDDSTELFSALVASLHHEFDPQTVTEAALVDNMAMARWRQMRLWGMEKAGLDHEIRKQAASLPGEDAPTRTALAFRALCDQSRSLDLMNRYETRYDRQFNRSHQRLFSMRCAMGRPYPADGESQRTPNSRRDRKKVILPNKPTFDSDPSEPAREQA